jgi:hypothetical protein
MVGRSVPFLSISGGTFHRAQRAFDAAPVLTEDHGAVCAAPNPGRIRRR